MGEINASLTDKSKNISNDTSNDTSNDISNVTSNKNIKDKSKSLKNTSKNKKKHKYGLNFKIILTFIIFGIFLFNFIFKAVVDLMNDTFYSNITESMSTIATMATKMIDGDDLYRYASTNSIDAAYYDTKETLRQIKESCDPMKYFYVVGFLDDELVYVYDVISDEELDENPDLYEYTIGTKYEKDFPEIAYNLTDIYTEKNLHKNKLLFGNFQQNRISIYAPIFNSYQEQVGVLAIDVDTGEYDILLMVVAFIIGIIILIGEFISILTMILLIKQIIIKPIRKIKNKTDNFVNDNGISEDDFLISEGNGSDEICELISVVNKMMLDTKAYIEEVRIFTAENERIGAELNVATRIQKQLLPCEFPAFPEIPEIDIYASMNPAKEVGGDFYDFFKIDDNHIGIVIADVSGKGVPAALFMVIAKTIIKNQALSGFNVSEILTNANNMLCEGNEEMLFVTAWLAIVDTNSGKVNFADAGHDNPVLIKKASEADFVTHERKQTPLATFEDVEYISYELQLEHGDVLFLYTDGVPEATNVNEMLFGNEKLLISSKRHANGSMKEMVEAIKADVDLFVDKADQFDDITMLAFKYI